MDIIMCHINPTIAHNKFNPIKVNAGIVTSRYNTSFKWIDLSLNKTVPIQIALITNVAIRTT
jgi:hypothetical protein